MRHWSADQIAECLLVTAFRFVVVVVAHAFGQAMAGSSKNRRESILKTIAFSGGTAFVLCVIGGGDDGPPPPFDPGFFSLVFFHLLLPGLYGAWYSPLDQPQPPSEPGTYWS